MGAPGFTLVELLVALGLTAVLLAGMAQVLGGSLSAFHRTHEGLAAQRALRWSLEILADDLQLMGHLMPLPGRTPPLAAPGEPGQGGLLLRPDQPIRGAPGAVADELSFVLDLPLPGTARLLEAIPGPDPGPNPGPEPEPGAGQGLSPPGPPPDSLNLRLDCPVALLPGDLALVEGVALDAVPVAAAAHLGPRASARLSLRDPAFSCAHPAGARVTFLRPLRVVRYALVRLEGAQPSLVRFETPLAADGAEPPWPRLLGTGAAQVVADRVTGLRVDFAPDPTGPGVRGRDGPATAANLVAALGVKAQDPLWFRQCPGILTVALVTCGPARPGVPPQTRTLTLKVVPRNFGLEAPP